MSSGKIYVLEPGDVVPFKLLGVGSTAESTIGLPMVETRWVDTVDFATIILTFADGVEHKLDVNDAERLASILNLHVVKSRR